MSKTKRPSLPDTRDPRFLDSVREVLQGMVGQRGDPLDSNVSFRDLIDTGVAEAARRFTQLPTGANPADFIQTSNPRPEAITPTRVTGFRASGGYRNVLLTWGQPTYRNHAFTEVYRARSADFGAASLVGTSPSRAYVDVAGSDEKFFYWVRHVGLRGTEGPLTGPESATTAVDADVIAEQMQGKVDENLLVDRIVSDIERVRGDESQPGSIANRIAQAEEKAEQELQDARDSIEGELGEKASITFVENAVAEEEQARVTAVGELAASVEENFATKTALSQVEADIYGASVEDFQQIQARFESVDSDVSSRATIEQLDQAKSDILGAEVSQFTGLQATFDGLQDGLDARATIDQLDTAIADATGSLAESINQIEATLGGEDGLSAQVETTSQAVADLEDGLSASFSVRLNAGGQVAGFGLTVDEGEPSVFAVAADEIYFVSPGSSRPEFDDEQDYTQSQLNETNFLFGAATVDGTKRFAFNVPVAIPEASISFVQIDEASITDLEVTDRAVLVNAMLAGITSVFDLQLQQNTEEGVGKIESENFVSEGGFRIMADGKIEVRDANGNLRARIGKLQ